MHYETIKYTNNEIEIDVMIDQVKNTIWLSRKQMSVLFNTSVDNIALHIKNILSEEKFDNSVYEESSATASDGKRYHVKIYNLQIILEIGNRIRSQNGILLQKWVEKYFESFEIQDSDVIRKERNNTYLNEYEIVKYKNDGVELDVRVSPKEDTIWLTLEQMSELFARDKSVISRHIYNLFLEGEVLQNQGVAKNATTGPDGKKYSYTFYNLDVIISVGYRVKSQNGILFRRWASKVLKNYLIKGYAIDKKRTLVTNENYINLINKVNSMDERLSKLERHNIKKEQLFFDGEIFNTKEFISELISSAQHSLILIDPYADIKALEYFKYKNNTADLTIFLSSKSKLSGSEIEAFNKEFGNLKVYKTDVFHDRFLIIDKCDLYHIGASLNHAGTKAFAVTKIEDKDLLDAILKKIKF